MAVYDTIGRGYARLRREEPRLAAPVHAALGDARSVANVGAGTGSYEPADRLVLAFEPSQAMREQRPPGRPAINAVGEHLPLDDDAVDAAMAVLAIHHFSDPERGVRELRRVARDRVVIMTYEPQLSVQRMWIATDYLPEIAQYEEQKFPPIAQLCDWLGGAAVEVLEVPRDCCDNFLGAQWGRPEALLDPAIRASNSACPRLAPEVVESAVKRLADDLASGAWDSRHGHLRTLDSYDVGLRLVISGTRPSA